MNMLGDICRFEFYHRMVPFAKIVHRDLDETFNAINNNHED